MKDLLTEQQARERHPILAFFAGRPVTVGVLLVAITVMGLISTNLMPVELFPGGLERKSLSIDVPVNRTGGLSSPMVVEKDITLPLEAELSTIPGVTELEADSRAHEADLDLEFDQDRDMDEAYAEVWAAIERARSRLPDDIGRIRVRRRRADSNAWPISSVTFSWQDGTKDPHLTLERVVQPYLESLDGVAGVEFRGTYSKYVVIDLDPEKARTYGIDMGQLMQNLRADNIRAPAGKVTVTETPGGGNPLKRDVFLIADSKFKSIQEIEELPVRPGLRLSDITRHGVVAGKAHQGIYETYSVSRYVRVNRERGAEARIYKEGEANTVAVGERIEAALEQLRNRPELSGFSIHVQRNQGESIKDSIATLMQTLMWGGMLAFLVMLLFLKSWRLSLIIALSIPLSMTMALAVMYFADQSVNLLVLMGFTLAAGMLLDNSIVVAENVFRRHSLGEESFASAVRGAGEVGLALVLATSTTVIVFITVVFMLDSEFLSFVMGKIGLPVCLSIAFSIVLAIGVIPMTMHRIGMLNQGRTSRFRRWFARRRKRLGAMWRKGGAARAFSLPGIAAWEIVALFAGRNSEGLPTTPVVDRLSVWYERLIRRAMPLRYLIVVVALAGTGFGIQALRDNQQRTDENQGNRDSIELRARFDDGTDVMVSRHALHVTEIAPGSPAEKAGLREGDFILRYNGRPVDTPADLERLGADAPRGALVPVDVARGTLTGTIEMEGGPPGVAGLMEDTAPLRDAIWATYAGEIEDALLGREDAAIKRKHAVENLGLSEGQARARHGRTPEEAREFFGIESLICSFSSGFSRFSIFLDPERVDKSATFYERIQAALPERAGVRLRGSFRGGGRGGGDGSGEVSVRIMGPDTVRLLHLAEEIELRLSNIEGLEGLRVDTDEPMDEVTLAVDRQRAGIYGVEPDSVSRVIGFQLGGAALRDYQADNVLLPLRVRFAPPVDASGNPRDPRLEDVAETRIATGTGGELAAKAFTETTGLASAGSGEIKRVNRQTTMRVVGTTSTDDLDRIRREVSRAMSTVEFPPGYSQQLGGRFGDFREQFQDLFKSLIWSGLLVFLVMCFLFESFLKPVCILFASVPGAILGGYALLHITETPLDTITYLGLLVLVGVVVNNGIVLVDLINRLRQQGMKRAEAVEMASRQRLRPIVLTSLTTAFGLVPMAIGDAQFVGMPYYPMGRMVLGGILVSMLYTLILVPLLYTVLDDFGLAVKSWLSVMFARKQRAGGDASPAPASPE